MVAQPPPGFVGVPSGAVPDGILPNNEPSLMSQPELAAKARKWKQMQGRKYGDRRGKTALVDTGKQELPPEHVRKIVKDHGDMSNRKYRAGFECLVSFLCVHMSGVCPGGVFSSSSHTVLS